MDVRAGSTWRCSTCGCPASPGPTVLPRILALDESIAVILITAVRTCARRWRPSRRAPTTTSPSRSTWTRSWASCARPPSSAALEREVRYLRAELDRAHGFDAAGGAAPAHGAALRADRAGGADATPPCSITAESGTGKELVARAIHRQSPRRAQPFVAVNLAAIPDTLLESELFGHEKGAFTGAHARKPGKFELAHGGTLFLDEVGSLRVDLQAKLLRALQEREIERLGGTRTIPVDVRVIAATNIDLQARRCGRAPSARTSSTASTWCRSACRRCASARSDIPLLVDHFVRKYSREFKKDVRGISRGARCRRSTAYDWPGNVRELENIIERSVALATRPVDPARGPAARPRHARGRPRAGRRGRARPRCRSRRRATASSRPTCCARSSARTGTRAAPRAGPRRAPQYPHRPAGRLGHPPRRAGDQRAAGGGGRRSG